MRMPRIWKKIIKLSTVLIMVLAFFLVSFLIAKKHNNNIIVKLEKELDRNTQEVYVAVRDIERGCSIETSMIKKEKRISDIDTTFYFTEGDIGSIAITEIQSESPILKAMVKVQDDKVDKTQREVNYNYFLFGKEIKNGDYVDVRIRYIDGEDYIVVSRCKVTLGNTDTQKVTLLLSEEEQLMICSALSDSSMYKATVYLTKYTHPSVQEQMVVTYQPNIEVIDLIMNNTNIDEVKNLNFDATKRIELEKRLFAYQKSYENFNAHKTVEEEIDKNEQEEMDNQTQKQADSNTENVIYYYDYAGQGVDNVLNSISDASNTQVREESINNEVEKEGVDNGGE